MKIIRTVILILLSGILATCTYFPPSRPVVKPSPAIRIGIVEKLDTLSFEADGPIDIFDQNDRIIGRQIPGPHWRVFLLDAKPVNLLYRLLYQEATNESAAQTIVASLTARGIPATIKQVKTKQFQRPDSYSYQVYLTPVFQSESDALNYNRSIAGRAATNAQSFYSSRPAGKIILQNQTTGRQLGSEGLIRVKGSGFRFKVRVGEGFHFEKQELRVYKDNLEFWIDRFGKLTVVNQIPLEEYLKGVVGSEMSPDFPLEALKAQAVTARSYTLSRFDKQHRLEPFDVCDEVHCHVYGGVERETPSVSRAVNETYGQVLMSADQICETFYASVCGGHGEHNENVWNGAPLPYLRGKLDAETSDRFPVNQLKDESNVRRWIESSPDVFCNTTKTEVPAALNYTKRYFRWTTRYTQSELSKIISDKTGERIGSLVEIIPVERGVSGRLKKIRLRGTLKTATIEGELAIRRALSPSFLFSSCFVVDRQGADFIIKGAGWGHGVGMCQTGAAMIALKGFSYRVILSHYYTNAKLVKLH